MPVTPHSIFVPHSCMHTAHSEKSHTPPSTCALLVEYNLIRLSAQCTYSTILHVWRTLSMDRSTSQSISISFCFGFWLLIFWMAHSLHFSDGKLQRVWTLSTSQFIYNLYRIKNTNNLFEEIHNLYTFIEIICNMCLMHCAHTIVFTWSLWMSIFLWIYMHCTDCLFICLNDHWFWCACVMYGYDLIE